MEQKRFVELKNEMHLIRQNDMQLSAKVDAKAFIEKNEKTYCKNCGSTLGLDCGDAEPDFNNKFCSKGCYEENAYEYEQTSYKKIRSTDLPIYRKWICGASIYFYRGRIVDGRLICDSIKITDKGIEYGTTYLSSVMSENHIESDEEEFNNAICKLITYLEK